jgi:hypothetical protein
MGSLRLSLIGLAVILLSGAGGYAIGHDDAPTKVDAREVQSEAFHRALVDAKREGFLRAFRHAQRRSQARGRRLGTRAGVSPGQSAGETAAGEKAAEEYAATAAVEAAAATPSSPASIPLGPGGTCPSGYNYSMGTCTTYDPYSCGPGEIRVHATLECIKVSP